MLNCLLHCGAGGYIQLYSVLPIFFIYCSVSSIPQCSTLRFTVVMLKQDFLYSRLLFCRNRFLPVIETSLSPKSNIYNLAQA